MLNLFIPAAWADTAPPNTGGGSFLIMIIIFLVLMYFMIIRPQMKQAKQHRTLIQSLSKGDEVAIANGLLGKIRDVGDNFILLEIADNVTIKIQKNAVSNILPKGSLKGL